jgi:putative transposase
VLGWAVDDRMRTEPVTTAMDRAVFTRGGRCRGTILHSDSHYTAHDMAAACSRHKLRGSMAPPVSAGITLAPNRCGRASSTNTTTVTRSPQRLELIAAVDNWMLFCNHQRRQSAIGMLSPIDYEQKLRATTEAS